MYARKKTGTIPLGVIPVNLITYVNIICFLLCHEFL